MALAKMHLHSVDKCTPAAVDGPVGRSGQGPRGQEVGCCLGWGGLQEWLSPGRGASAEKGVGPD